LRFLLLFVMAPLACGGAAAVPDAAPDGAGPGLPADAAGPQSRANGTLSDWQTLLPMPLPRANHCAVAIGGAVVVIGGNYRPAGATDFVTTDEIDVAHVGADGALSPWMSAGRTPSPVSGCTAVAVGTQVWLIDGLYDDTSYAGKVLAAELSQDGTLGQWKQMGALGPGVRVLYSDAYAGATQLFVAGSSLPDNGNLTFVLSSPMGATLGAFTTHALAQGFRGHPQFAFGGGFFYALGGYLDADQNNVMSADVFAAAASADATFGDGFSTTPLPSPTGFGEAVAVDGYVFVVGGRGEIFSPDARADVISAPIGGDGRLGAWSPQKSLPQGRTNLRVVAAQDFLYVLGGGHGGPGLDNVFAARVRFPTEE
jgi:hypothetical protein